MNPLFRRALLYGAVSFLAGLAMINSDSLWLDEGATMHFVRQSAFGDWCRSLKSNTNSEALMPLSMFVAWVGGKLIGTGEWQLRALNLLWVGLAGAALGLVGWMLKNRALLALFLVHPFLWFYANEARPYAMQICAGAWLLYVLVRIESNSVASPIDLWIFGVAAVAGLGSSLLFAFPLVAVLVVFALFWWRGKLRIPWTPRYWLPLAVAFVMLATLGIYFLYPLARGAAGARLWRVTPLNLVFCLYEGLGFSGLGPPRHELRELARTPAQLLDQLRHGRFVFGLGFLGLIYLVLAGRLWKIRRDPLLQWTAGLTVLAASLVFASATVAHFPFWGRHLAPLFPFVVLVLARATSSPPRDATHTAGIRLVVLPLLLMSGLAASSFMLRFDADYRKDDYRSASRLAVDALTNGKVVWWSADRDEVAAYYGLSATNSPAIGRLVFCVNSRENDTAASPPPDLVFRSKPDIFDRQGNLTAYLAKNQYRVIHTLPAFTVWTQPTSRAATLAK